MLGLILSGIHLAGILWLTEGAPNIIQHDVKDLPCGMVKLPAANGMYRVSSDGMLGEYKCEDGYIMVGSSRVTCGRDGRWIGEPPICINWGCALDNLENGQVIYSYNRAMANFECDKGFHMKGPSLLVCDRKHWNGTQPVCVDPYGPSKKQQEKDDYPYYDENGKKTKPPKGFKSHIHWLDESDYSCIQNGAILPPPEYEHIMAFTRWIIRHNKARLYTRYMCEWGYVPDKEEQNMYCVNRHWKGDTPRCKPVPEPNKALYGFQMDHIDPASMDHQDWLKLADYSCGGHTHGAGHTVPSPAVEGATDHLRYVVLDGFPHLYVQYKCRDGMHIQGRPFMYCKQRGWVGDKPRCIRGEPSKEEAPSDNPCDRNNGGCEQICEYKFGRQTCHCQKGYELSKDGYNCQVISKS